MWLLWAPMTSVWVGDFRTINLFDFVILFCSFFICFVCLILSGYRYWHPKCSFYFLTLYDREISGLRGFCGPVGVV